MATRGFQLDLGRTAVERQWLELTEPPKAQLASVSNASSAVTQEASVGRPQ
jgi:hypothetical protein